MVRKTPIPLPYGGTVLPSRTSRRWFRYVSFIPVDGRDANLSCACIKYTYEQVSNFWYTARTLYVMEFLFSTELTLSFDVLVVDSVQKLQETAFYPVQRLWQRTN